MAKFYMKNASDPSRKKDYVPSSVKVRTKYRKILIVSVIINIILTTLVVMNIVK